MPGKDFLIISQLNDGIFPANSEVSSWYEYSFFAGLGTTRYEELHPQKVMHKANALYSPLFISILPIKE